MKQGLKATLLTLAMPCFLMLFSGAGFPDAVTFDFSYKVKVSDIPAGAEDLRLYLPAPASDHAQQITNFQVKSGQNIQWKKDPEFGNKYGVLHLSKREMPEKLSLKLQFRVKRQTISQPNQYPQTAESHQKHLLADSLIPLNPEIRQETAKALKGHSANTKPTKAFYDYLLTSMKYDKSGKGWGRGDALYACNAKEGNCTDFHSLFLGMCRSKEIPARFHIGFPLPKDKAKGTISGYHCWAEFYDGEKGWVPVDISEAWKSQGKAGFYYGSLDPYRVRFTTGRDIAIKTPDGPTKRLNYFINPEVWVDGKKHEAVKTTFRLRKRSEHN